MKLFLLTCFFLCFCFSGIAVKIWGKKNGEFAGTCASQNPFLNKENEPCGLCGKIPKYQKCDIVDPQSN